MHVYSNGPSENGIIGLEKGISLGVNYYLRAVKHYQCAAFHM